MLHVKAVSTVIWYFMKYGCNYFSNVLQRSYISNSGLLFARMNLRRGQGASRMKSRADALGANIKKPKLAKKLDPKSAYH